MSNQTSNQPEMAELPLQRSDLEESPLRPQQRPLPFSLEERPLLPLGSEPPREQYPPEQVDSNLRAANLSPAPLAPDTPSGPDVDPSPSPRPLEAAAPEVNRVGPVAHNGAAPPAPETNNGLLDLAELAPPLPPLEEAERRMGLPGPDVYPTLARPAALEPVPEIPLDGPSDPLFDMDQLGAVEPPALEQPPTAAEQVAAALAEEEEVCTEEAPAWTRVFDAPSEPGWQAPHEFAEPAASHDAHGPVESEARESAPHELDEQAPSERGHSPYEPEVHTAHVEQAGYQRPPQPHGRRGIFARLFGGGQPVADAQHGLVRYEQKPGLLRVFARRNYQREATLASMRAGFSDLSELMRDIRDGLHATVERQGELLESLRYLPVIAEQNQQSAQRLEEQSQAQAQLQVETVRALREQMQSQQVHQEQVGRVLGSISRESRDQKREIDELEGRMQRMREHDEAISSNLLSVSTAVRSVSEQGSAQGELARRMQESFDERARHLEKVMRKQAARQGFAMLLTMLIAVTALGAVAAAGYLYLKQTGGI